MTSPRTRPSALLVLAVIALLTPGLSSAGDFKAGAAAVDITPKEFPVIVNGGFIEKQATKAFDPLHARAIVLDDGKTRLAICVVDTCMMTRELIDSAKEIAHRETGIPTDRMLVSATHTHSAPSAMACLGTRLDKNYAAFLPGKIAEAIAGAAKNLAPARVGWAVVPAWEYTNCRRWIRRPDKVLTDPFGVVSARANMHPGNLNPDAIGPSGPIDPDVSLLSVQTRDGRPLALLANFSMHYFGASALSADYFGIFSNGIGKLIGAGKPSVGIMSQGTSGDSQWRDYADRAQTITAEQYAGGLMKLVADAYRKIEHRDSVPLAMAESKLTLRRRVADAAWLEWARKIAGPMGDRVAANQTEVYAREQLLIAAEPERELKLQALRIGDLGITAIPDEVYAITGLKLKAQSPLRPTMNIELANGSEGYIPPPEQHKLGGYTTWAARTAGLVPEAEPRIVEAVLALLEKVSGEKRRAIVDEHGPYAKAILAAKPLAYWRMNEIIPPTAGDSSGNHHDATYDWDHGVAFYLPGAGSGMGASSQPSLTATAFSGPNQINRSPHFAGGSMKAELKQLGADCTVTFWLWNGLDPKARATTGIAFMRGGERLGITGTSGEPGHLFFTASADAAPIVGRTALLLKDWHHVALVREGKRVTVYLDGAPELSGEANGKAEGATLFFGGRHDDGNTLEGKIDEAAVFNRVLSAAEIAAQYQVSGPPPRAIIVQPIQPKPSARMDMEPPKFTGSYDAALDALKPIARLPLHAPERVFAGERLRLDEVKLPGGAFSVSFGFRNHLGNAERPVTAYLFSRGPDGGKEAPGDHLGIGGNYRAGYEGRLMFYNGNERHETLLGALAGETLARLLKAHAAEPMMVAAVMSSATPHLRALARVSDPNDPLLNTALGLKDREALAGLLVPTLNASSGRFSSRQLADFARFLDLLAQHGSSLDALRNTSPPDTLSMFLRNADTAFSQARDTANDPAISASERIAAAGLMSRTAPMRPDAIRALTPWLEPQQSANVQATALRALGETGTVEVPAALAQAWPAFSPATRQVALAAWMRREPWAFDFVQRIERGELPASAVDTVQRGRLLKHESARVRKTAVKLFAVGTFAVRGKVVEAYRPALSLKGDATRGRDIYLRTCAVCHRRGDDGKDIGPDLISVVEHPPEKLLASILDPNLDIQPGFNAYTCTLKSGEQIYGLVAAETANSVTMKLADASLKTVLRNQIVTLQSQNLSLMPEGLEAAIPQQDMADLIQFLRTPLPAKHR